MNWWLKVKEVEQMSKKDLLIKCVSMKEKIIDLN